MATCTCRCSNPTPSSGTRCYAGCSRRAWPSGAPSRASTVWARRRSGTTSSSRTRPRSSSCAASRSRSTPTASSTPAPSSTERRRHEMNGAQALIRTLVDGGVDVCFTNPGTSEMHFVAALDSVPEMRGSLGLFEGVATGAADGYGRMADKPAATLLHLGPGLGNGLANLHNARKGKTGIVNIVGDHATYHKKYDAQLESDIDTVARNVSGWIRRSETSAAVPRDAAEAVAVARAGEIATLILPADASWSEGAEPAPPVAVPETQ